MSEHTIDLLIKHGFLYDSSLMGADYIPYRARRGDVAELGKPYKFGEETGLIEMPISWSLDDYPHFEFVRTPQTVLPGLQPARAVMQSWLDEFLYMKKSVDWGVLTYTMHPFVIGRGYRMLALEGLVETLAKEGAVFMTMAQAAEEAKAAVVRLAPTHRCHRPRRRTIHLSTFAFRSTGSSAFADDDTANSFRLRHLLHIPIVDLLAIPMHHAGVLVDVRIKLLEILDAVRGAGDIRMHADREDPRRFLRLPDTAGRTRPWCARTARRIRGGATPSW